MNYFQEILLTFLAASLALSGMAQRRANFHGEWKLNESKSDLVGSSRYVYLVAETGCVQKFFAAGPSSPA